MLHLKVFVAAPSDVADERALAVSVIDSAQYDPLLHSQVTFEAAVWDKPGGRVPMLATLTPQAAISAGLARPSECDIVIVIMWVRFGTPLPHPLYQKPDGTAYLSGTEWEFEDAMAAAHAHGRPQVVVYRRMEKKPLDDEAPDFDSLRRQKQLVRDFFAQFADPVTGAITRGYNEYVTPDEFRQQFEHHLKVIVKQLLDQVPTLMRDPHDRAVTPSLWAGSPFPGLRAFTPSDAPIFFGRGRETDELLRRVADSRFVAVVGASGSGKSSLVGAGAIPRIAEGAIEGVPGWILPEFDTTTGQWRGARFTPGELGNNPFIALAAALAPLVGRAARDIATDLVASPANITVWSSRALANKPAGSELLLFIDQFEELFTVVSSVYLDAFVECIDAAARCAWLRCVLTMRSDFYHRCLDIAPLARLLELAQFPLAGPIDTLLEMIARPAERAGLRFEEGLAGRILSDTLRQPGALPLLAYALDELYQASTQSGLLTHTAYERLGEVEGAIGTRAELVFNNQLDERTRDAFSAVFRELVEVDEHGRVTRRRAPLDALRRDENVARFVDVFTVARLFVTSIVPGSYHSVVEVAHESLFQSWPRLWDWVRTVEEDLRLLQKLGAAVREWAAHDRDEAYLWPHERLQDVAEMVRRLQPDLDETTRAFVRPEYERLLVTFGDPRTEEYRRRAIADRLLAIGAAAVPELLDALRSPHANVRTASAEVLARLGSVAVTGLSAAVDDPAPDVRFAATSALRLIGGESARAGLIKALRDSDARVRTHAAGALTATKGDEVLPELEAVMGDPEVDVRWTAIGVLGAYGSAAVPGLLRAYAEGDARTQTLVFNALRGIGETAAGALVDALVTGDPRSRAAAAEGLVAIGRSAAGAVAQAAGHTDADVRAHVVEILSAIRERSVTPVLLAQLDDADVEVRRLSAGALRGLADENALGVLGRALRDPDEDVRWRIGEVLVDIGEPAVAVLLPILADTDPSNVAAIAAVCLRQIGQPAVAGLIETLRTGDASAAAHAVGALSGIGPPAVPPVLEFASVADARTLRLVRETLSHMREEALPVLLERAADPDPVIRSTVALALGGIGSPDSVEALARMVTDTDDGVRHAALDGLGLLGWDGVEELLLIMLHGLPDLRVAAGENLRVSGGYAVPGLLEVLHSGDAESARVAEQTLERIVHPLAQIELQRWRRRDTAPTSG